MGEFTTTLAAALALALGGSEPPREQTMETVMQDDAELLFRDPATVRRNVRTMADLGVDRVRLTASWSTLAPATDSPRRPQFDATDSEAYPAEPFTRLDEAVREVRAAGMDVMIDVAFFAPRWAVGRGGAGGRNVWKPSVSEFGQFTRAVADRYSGQFSDPDSPDAAPLPAVRLWTTWNEPNHHVFLQPQWERTGSRRLPFAPHHYRRMHNVAYDQIKESSAANRVLIGGLTSFSYRGKGAKSSLGPIRFTRELACVDSRMRPLRRRACRDFRPLRADGFAQHPYSLRTAPDDRSPDGSDRVQIGELDRLTSLLADLSEAGRIESPLDLYLTEYGYETNPPSPTGRAPDEHARFLGQATYLAYRSPSVRMFPQFLLRDIGPDLSKPVGSKARWRDYQTGIVQFDGAPKPAVLQAFRLPFHAEAARNAKGENETVAFGQVRPSEGPQAVSLERLDFTAGWVTEAEFATDLQGYYEHRVSYREGSTYRAVWTPSEGEPETSPEVTVDAP